MKLSWTLTIFLIIFFDEILVNGSFLPVINTQQRINSNNLNSSSGTTPLPANNTRRESTNPSMFPIIYRDENNGNVNNSTEEAPKKETKSQSRPSFGISLGKTVSNLPSLFTPKSSSHSTPSAATKYQVSSSRDLSVRTSSKSISGGSNSQTRHPEAKIYKNENQLSQAVEKLIELMLTESSDSSASSFRYRSDLVYNLETLRMRKKTEDVSNGLRQISDPSILEAMKAFPVQKISLDHVLRAMERIWKEVDSVRHQAIFELVADWAIKVFKINFAGEYFSLLEFIVYSDIQFETYARAVEFAHLLSINDVANLVQRLLIDFLTLKEEDCSHGADNEYEFYGKFNVYFLFLAKNYPEFWKLPFIKNYRLPESIPSTPTLQFIYKSMEFLKFLLASDEYLMDVDELTRTFREAVDFCLQYGLGSTWLIQQIDLILQHNQSVFESLSTAFQIVFLNVFAEAVGKLAQDRHSFNQFHIQNVVFAVCIKFRFNRLLKTLLNHLPTFFSEIEFNHLLELLDQEKVEENSKYPTLLVFFGNIKLDSFNLAGLNLSSLKNVVIKMALDIIKSITAQQLSQTSNFLTQNTSNSNQLIWSLPEMITSTFYELLSISDFLVIPLLFIERVFHLDAQKSKVVSKYRYGGKPNYHNLADVINEIIEDQGLQVYYHQPSLQVKIIFPSTKRPMKDGPG